LIIGGRGLEGVSEEGGGWERSGGGLPSNIDRKRSRGWAQFKFVGLEPSRTRAVSVFGFDFCIESIVLAGGFSMSLRENCGEKSKETGN
jgi:hypothetical protein